jgi:hypothetical protein
MRICLDISHNFTKFATSLKIKDDFKVMHKKLNRLNGITVQHTRNINANTVNTKTKVRQAGFYPEKKSKF